MGVENGKIGRSPYSTGYLPNDVRRILEKQP